MDKNERRCLNELEQSESVEGDCRNIMKQVNEASNVNELLLRALALRGLEYPSDQIRARSYWRNSLIFEYKVRGA